jgi:predicted ATP-binding protein involved in virulence
MRLSEVQIINFRCFESLKIHFDAAVNVHVFVGDNGAGKSTILDAIALGLAPIARRFGQIPGGRRRGVLDIMEDSRHTNRVAALFDGKPSKPYCHLSFKGQPNGQTVEWDVHLLRDKSMRTRAKVPHFLGTKQLYEALDSHVFEVAEGTGGLIPVFAYYGTSRAVIDIPQRKRSFLTEFTRETAMKLSLDPVSRFKDAFEWFFAMERDELAERNQRKNYRYKLPVLEAVRRAIHAMLPEFSDPRITTQPLHFQLTHKNPDGSVTDLFAEQLSDGYRTMLALVMDFARRLAQANPQLADPLASHAVLLIDEVDLHLHPDWQQKIIPDLERTFPNTQFILTTHSPQVLTSIHSRSVRVVRDGQLAPSPGGIYGAESKRTLERVMHIPSRPPDNERVQRLERLFSLIAAENFVAARSLALDLQRDFESNEPSVDEALTEIDNRLWEKGVGL